MSRRETDIKDFLIAHPEAQLFEALDGNSNGGILLPGYRLPEGWTKPVTDLVWLIPASYPVQKLDCFWIDHDVLSPSDQAPANTQIQACPLNTGIQRRWISWHIDPWNPVRHDIETWLTSMKDGLIKATGRVR